jgi:hypothetical protein
MMVTDHKDLVIEALADSEAALREHVQILEQHIDDLRVALYDERQRVRELTLQLRTLEPYARGLRRQRKAAA